MIDGEEQDSSSSLKDEGLSVPERIDAIWRRDQEHRSLAENFNPQKIDPEQDRQNREEIKKIIDAGELTTADHFNVAALVFQHGEGLVDIEQAFKLSLEAAKLGLPPHATLIAQAFDRYYIRQQQKLEVPEAEIKQRFNTHYNPDDFTAVPLDGQATEEQRRLFLPHFEKYSDITKEQKKETREKLNAEWQNMNQEERKQILDLLAEQFAKI